MHIVIIGGGDIGYQLARDLKDKHQKIVVVDKNPATARMMGEKLDLAFVTGNGANLEVLEKADIRSAQILIAVTESDEVNIIACMIAKTFGVPHTVARVRNPESAGSIDVDTRGLTQTQLQIDLIISPKRTTAQEIAKRVLFPDATEVEEYAGGRAMHMAVKVAANAELVNRPLRDLELPKGCLIAGIRREDGVFVLPGGGDRLEEGDKVYLVGKSEIMNEAGRFFHRSDTRIERVVILGGGEIGFSLANLLEADKQKSFFIKLIEKDEERVEMLNRSLGRTLVVQGDGTDLCYFNEEEIAEADVLVAATGDDRINLVASLLGRRLGVKKVITEITRIRYASLYRTLEVGDTVNPHLITAAKILRYTRRGDVLSLSLLQDEVAETMERILPATSPVVGKKISAAGFPQGLLVGTIVRGREVIIPDGDTRLRPDDHLILFSTPEVSRRTDRYFS